MGYKREKIDCFGKPYKHVGHHPNGKPKFVKKPLEVLERELGKVGLAPTFDDSGWFTGTVKKKKENSVALLPEGQTLPDHMLDAARFREQILNGPSLITDPPFMAGKQFGKGETMKSFGNPCSEIPLGIEPGYLHPPAETKSYGKMTMMGHRLYDGPAVEVNMWQDEGSMECEIAIKQHRCMSDKTISFGPLSTTLSDLFDKGYWLETKLDYKHFNVNCQRWTRVYLTDGVDRYRLYSIDFAELQATGKIHGQYDLGSAITDRTNLLRTHSSARYPKPVIQEKIVERFVERDPFEVLAERYPRGKKPSYNWDTVVGNRTLRERFQDHVGAR